MCSAIFWRMIAHGLDAHGGRLRRGHGACAGAGADGCVRGGGGCWRAERLLERGAGGEPELLRRSERLAGARSTGATGGAGQRAAGAVRP